MNPSHPNRSREQASFLHEAQGDEKLLLTPDLPGFMTAKRLGSRCHVSHHHRQQISDFDARVSSPSNTVLKQKERPRQQEKLRKSVQKNDDDCLLDRTIVVPVGIHDTINHASQRTRTQTYPDDDDSEDFSVPTTASLSSSIANSTSTITTTTTTTTKTKTTTKGLDLETHESLSEQVESLGVMIRQSYLHRHQHHSRQARWLDYSRSYSSLSV